MPECEHLNPHVFEAAKTQLTGQGKPQGNSKSQAALFLIFAFHLEAELFGGSILRRWIILSVGELSHRVSPPRRSRG
jgi:hypothetical protein